MSQDPHAVAIRALLDAHPHLTVYPFDDAPAGRIVPDGTDPPYVAAYFHRHFQADGQLPIRSREWVTRAVIHSVGGTSTGADIVAGNVAEALLDVRPTVAGRKCWPIRHEQSIPPQPDESTGRLVMDLVDVYVLRSIPS